MALGQCLVKNNKAGTLDTYHSTWKPVPDVLRSETREGSTVYAQGFGKLVERRMHELGISQNRLASRLGELPDGRVFDATQIRLIREGRRRLDHILVQRLIDLLEMDPAEAWAAAGLWPPDLDVQGYRRFRQTAMTSNGVTNRQLRYDPELVEQIDRLRLRRRPTLALVGGRAA